MQAEAPEAFDLTRETEATHRLYGLKRGDTEGFGWQCMVARRLAERGVRFIELIDGDTRIDYNWDTHANMSNYNKLARNVDQSIAGLIKDLKARGMLEDTLVVWTTEFGRMPFSQGKTGRDHNGGTFVTWLAGGGAKGGSAYGQSDRWGWKSETGTSSHDMFATILHLLGIDHERLTVRHNGIDRRLTDVHGHVIQEILA